MGIIKPKLMLLGVLSIVGVLSSVPAIYLLYLVDDGKSPRLTGVRPNEYNMSLSQTTEIASDPMAKERLKMRLETKKAKASEKTVSLLFKLTTEIVILPTLILETPEPTHLTRSSNSTVIDNSTLTTTVKTTTVEDDEKDDDEEEPETTSERPLVWSKKVKKRSGKRKKRNKKSKKRYKKTEIHTTTTYANTPTN